MIYEFEVLLVNPHGADLPLREFEALGERIARRAVTDGYDATLAMTNGRLFVEVVVACAHYDTENVSMRIRESLGSLPGVHVQPTLEN